MKILTLGFTLVLLAACATQTHYSSANSDGSYGYSDSRITENRYRVSFKGNTRTSSNEVKDMALLRAAELTLLNDYDWFRVVSQDTQQNVTTTPETSARLSTGSRVYRDCGLLGCTTTVSPAYSGAEVITRREVDRYTTSIEIVMGKGELEDQTSAYDAAQLRRNLEPRF